MVARRHRNEDPPACGPAAAQTIEHREDVVAIVLLLLGGSSQEHQSSRIVTRILVALVEGVGVGGKGEGHAEGGLHLLAQE